MRNIQKTLGPVVLSKNDDHDDVRKIYFLGDKFNQSVEKNYHWNDPTLNIEWPTEVKNVIVSRKDASNPLFNEINTIILGSDGYLGSNLLKYIPKSIGLNTRLEDVCILKEKIKFIKPKYVISAAGISGKPTIDWCESHKDETINVNFTCQLQLIQICKELGIHLTILGSGAVFDGDKMFSETDKANYTGTFYSKSRVVLENIIHDAYIHDVLYLRILYPITGDGNPKCFLEKLKTRTENIHNTRITATVIPSLFPKLQGIMEHRLTGILNFVNEKEIGEFIGADSLKYLSIDGLHKAVKGNGFCNACFTGNYPVDKRVDKKEINSTI
jgi:dTDP-4-dehydrorhamnose reductase